jgi:uncharacterized membrane protein YebE (DUF533 family)
MGFLKNLMSDMIGESVGVDPRRLVRLAGGRRNLLLLGAGAALAGGLASTLLKKQGASGVSPAPGVPPPPPPPPPPPAAAAGADVEAEVEAGDEGEELPPQATYAIVRTMVAAALADGSLDPAEKKVIQERLEDSELSAAEKRQIHQDLVLPPTPAELAALAPEAEGRELLYRFAAAVVLADRQVSDLERGWLDRLARALAIDAERAAALDLEIFAP